MPPEGVDHTTCPRCSARVRIIRKRRVGNPGDSGPPADDGFIRFPCPCGRRLKVSAIDRPSHGKCPDCDRVVPVPVGASTASSSKAESPTEDMAAVDIAMLDAWAKGHLAGSNGSGGGGSPSTAEMPFNAPGRRAEAGFRVCPRCGKPVHLNSDTCRACGTPVPKR
jgi:hypothetical protein